MTQWSGIPLKPEIIDQQDSQFLQQILLKQQLGVALTPDETNRITALSQADPDRFNRLLNQIYTNNGGDPNNPNAKFDPNSILNGLTNSNTHTNITRNIQNNTTRTEFIDLPTPQKFLDDWTNAYNIHITGLVQSGAMRPEVADFARNFEQNLFGEYLKKQTDMLLQGQPIFKTVGMNPANNKDLGTRPGGTQTQQSTTNESSQQGTSTTPAGPSTTGAGQAVDTSQNSTYNLNETTKDNVTNDVVQRDQLDYVHSLAPLDFLKDAATTQRFNLLYASQKGLAGIGGREAQTRAGEESGATKRI